MHLSSLLTKTWLIGILLGFGTTQVNAVAELGDKAPNFSAKTLAGQPVSLLHSNMGEKPVLLIFWATWCPNCKREIPDVSDLYKEMGDRLSILAINIGINDTADKAGKYKYKHSMKYPVIFDEGSHITNTYKIIGTPTQIIVGTNGTIRYRGIKTPTSAEIKGHWAELTTK